jgi:peptide/nickel transport system substrate-binding protein
MRALLLVSLLVALHGAAAFAGGTAGEKSSAALVDEFHPDRQPDATGARPALPKPAYGGRAIVHIDMLPKSLCYTVESGGVVRRILQEMHETLLARDFETFEIKPVLCASWTVEDRIVPNADAAESMAFGDVQDGGDVWIVTPKSLENPQREERRIAKTSVERVERGTVFTFRLKQGVRWHDGHEFDARDVAFSLWVYANPTVRCDDKRFAYADVSNIEILNSHTVRVTYGHQYFMALMNLGELFLLPSHLYDLGDPDNLAADPEYWAKKRAEKSDWVPTREDQGAYVNENVHNKQFVGLGPYALADYTNEYIEAKRFDGYFDAARGGYLDTLRWRAIPDSSAAFRAFLSGELDFFDMVTSDDYFSSALETPEFKARAYRGWHETAAYWFIGWNCRKAKLADPRVRRALAHLFDFDEFKETFYRGLARQVTGLYSPSSPAYDKELRPYPFDERAAKTLLAEAGWYDRDGDGKLDQDGEPLVIELLMQAGNAVGKSFGAKYQENLKHAGITLVVTPLDWAALNKRKTDGEFDAVALGWAPPFESDPDQMFHSRWGLAEKRGSNFVGFADPECDKLIDAGRAELDWTKRAATWRALHRQLYAAQPYLFAYNPPRKFVMNRGLRGFQSLGLDPNYSLRRWYFAEGTPGTRARPGK